MAAFCFAMRIVLVMFSVVGLLVARAGGAAGGEPAVEEVIRAAGNAEDDGERLRLPGRHANTPVAGSMVDCSAVAGRPLPGEVAREK